MSERWATIGIRSYRRTTTTSVALVFGAYRPSCLWAWAVYWSGGHAAGVENSFRRAKKEADARIEKVAGGGDGR